MYELAICHESYIPPLSDHAIISPEATRCNKASENVVYYNGDILPRGEMSLKIYVFRLTHPIDIILFRHFRACGVPVIEKPLLT